MNSHFPRTVAVLLAVGLLAGCARHDDDDASDASDHVASSVAVTTVAPVQRRFHDSIEAFGSAQGDLRRARSLNLAHGGEVVALMVAEGQPVHTGDALLKIATDPATRSAYAQAQSALTLADGELARTTQLVAQHLATESQLAAARKAVSDAEAGMQAQQALGGAVAEEAVTAPGDGVVTHLQVALGERVPANAPLLDFTPMKGLIAQLGVQPDQAAGIRPGMPVLLHAVYGDAPEAQGSVSMLGRAVDPTTHLVPVQAEIPVALSARLVNGAALDARIQTDGYDAWAVPRAALRHDDDGDYLFQLDHGKARRVNVKLRSPDGDTVGVTGPLDAALPVVVTGAYELDDGMAVREQSR
jgi:RND family efflux transporter MFP subunit